MNKLKISLAVLALLLVTGGLQAETRDDGWTMVEAPVSSGNFTGIGRCRVKAIYASTGTFGSNGTEFFLFLNTGAFNHIDGPEVFDPTNYKAPPMHFPWVSTGTISAAASANGVYYPLHKVMDYGDDGVAISSRPYVFKSAASSGYARRVYLLLKQ